MLTPPTRFLSSTVFSCTPPPHPHPSTPFLSPAFKSSPTLRAHPSTPFLSPAFNSTPTLRAHPSTPFLSPVFSSTPPLHHCTVGDGSPANFAFSWNELPRKTYENIVTARSNNALTAIDVVKIHHLQTLFGRTDTCCSIKPNFLKFVQATSINIFTKK